MLTTTFSRDTLVAAAPGVYAPQDDSYLLLEALAQTTSVQGRSVLDLCTGTGIAAIAAARLGARKVTAIDVSRRAIRCTRRNARAAGVAQRITACVGTHGDASIRGRYDVVLCNPPYVPARPRPYNGATPERGCAAMAWDAGPDGRLVLDPLCDSAAGLLEDGGVLLVVQSEFADPGRSIRMLRRQGVDAEVVLTQRIPFGPVLTERASWMEVAGLIPAGLREEELVVIRGEKL